MKRTYNECKFVTEFTDENGLINCIKTIDENKIIKNTITFKLSEEMNKLESMIGQLPLKILNDENEPRTLVAYPQYMIYEKENISIKLPYYTFSETEFYHDYTLDLEMPYKEWNYLYIIDPLGNVNRDLIKLLNEQHNINMNLDFLGENVLESLYQYKSIITDFSVPLLIDLLDEYFYKSLACKALIKILREDHNSEDISTVSDFWDIFQKSRIVKDEKFNEYDKVITTTFHKLTFNNYLDNLGIEPNTFLVYKLDKRRREGFIQEHVGDPLYTPAILNLESVDLPLVGIVRKYSVVEKERLALNRRIYYTKFILYGLPRRPEAKTEFINYLGTYTKYPINPARLFGINLDISFELNIKDETKKFELEYKRFKGRKPEIKQDKLKW